MDIIECRLLLKAAGLLTAYAVDIPAALFNYRHGYGGIGQSRGISETPSIFYGRCWHDIRVQNFQYHQSGWRYRRGINTSLNVISGTPVTTNHGGWLN